MKFKDYYQILGVAESATQEEIKRAYRKKARLYHPDVSKEANAEEKFKEVNEAHEALRDEKRRAEYDQLKKSGYRNGDDFQRPPDWQRGGGFNPDAFGGGDFGDFFESIFGSGMGGAGGFGHSGSSAGFGQAGSRRRPQQGDDIKLKVMVALENAFRGGNTTIKIPSGSGQPGKSLSVKIPAGVIDGQQLRLRSQGRPGLNGGTPGDLLLTLKLKKHHLFTIDGADVVLELPVTPYEAVTGIKVNVPTLAGDVTLSLSSNTRSGSKLRLRGRGLPASPVGDQIVVVQVLLPENPSAEVLELLQKLDAETSANPRRHFEKEQTS